MIRFMLGVLLGFLIWADQCRAEPYFFAGIGQTTFSYQHEYIQEADRSSSSTVFGLGYRVSDWLSIEGSVRDLGAYRFVLEKPVQLYRSIYLDVPGYVDLDVSGLGLSLRWGKAQGWFAKTGIVSLTAEAQLHTPFGYKLYHERLTLPIIEGGWAIRSAEFGYTWMPYLHGYGITARFSF